FHLERADGGCGRRQLDLAETRRHNLRIGIYVLYKHYCQGLMGRAEFVWRCYRSILNRVELKAPPAQLWRRHIELLQCVQWARRQFPPEHHRQPAGAPSASAVKVLRASQSRD